MTTQAFDVQLPIDIKGIMEILPHRYPFLLVDRIVELEQGKTITGIKNGYRCGRRAMMPLVSMGSVISISAVILLSPFHVP